MNDEKFQILITPHSQCRIGFLNEIAQAKSEVWSYTISEHIQWIETRLAPDDLHITIRFSENIVAYASLINIDLTVEGNNMISAFGLSSIFSVKRNEGLGTFLAAVATDYISYKRVAGLLFCKPKLVGFYEKNNWVQFQVENLECAFNLHEIAAMVTPNLKSASQLKYCGDEF